MTQDLKKLNKRLEKIEKELDTCRTSVLQDGWQTQRYAKKARKWDILAQEKMKIIQQIEDLKELEYNEGMKNAYYCVACGAINMEDCCCDTQ